MEANQEQQIQKLKAGRGIFNFEGKLITKIIGGWEFQGTKYSTPEEVLKAIEVAEGYLEGSIVVVNKGAINCTNTANSQDLGTDGTHVWER